MIKSANSSETSDCNYPYLKVLSDVMARISNHRLPSKETDDLKRFNFFTICILCVSQKCILDITLIDTWMLPQRTQRNFTCHPFGMLFSYKFSHPRSRKHQINLSSTDSAEYIRFNLQDPPAVPTPLSKSTDAHQCPPFLLLRHSLRQGRNMKEDSVIHAINFTVFIRQSHPRVPRLACRARTYHWWNGALSSFVLGPSTMLERAWWLEEVRTLKQA